MKRPMTFLVPLTNVRTGGKAVNQHFLFGKFNDAGDFYWGTELEHPRR